MSIVTEFFKIAGLTIKVTFEHKGEDAGLLPSFVNFRVSEPNAEPYITVVAGRCRNNEAGIFLDKVKTPVGYISLQRITNGYRCLLYDNVRNLSCVIEADRTFTHCICETSGSFTQKQTALKNALFLVYSAAASFRNTIIIHSSVIMHNGKAYCFLGRSGTGKSTHSDLWIKNVPGSSILNDDGPILQFCGGKVHVCGSPWSGKRSYYRNETVDMGALVIISRAQEDSIERLSPIDAFGRIYSSCACFKYDSVIRDNFLNTYTSIIEHSPSYILHCLPDDEAALLCSRTVEK